jgi:hypothetical protein
MFWVEGPGSNLCEDKIHNSQFKVAPNRFTATLSSNSLEHNETSRFFSIAFSFPIETRNWIHVRFRHEIATTLEETRP